MRRIAVAASLMLATLSCGPACAAGDPSAAVRALIGRDGIQTNLPTQTSFVDYLNFSLPPRLVDALLWGGVILGALIIASSLRDNIPGWDRSRSLEAERETRASAVSADALAAAQTQADDLAAGGAFAEAMHVLLLRALAEVRDRLKLSFADSLTSREILRRAPLDASARQAFSGIIGDVELTHFGDAFAGAEDYARCRSQFNVLRGALAMRGQA